MATEEELQWIGRAQAGDARALDWIVRSQWERVQRLLLRVWGPRQELEDLVQNTFLETLKALPSFRRDSELSTFVSGIAVRVALRARRPAKVVREAVAFEEPSVASSLTHADTQAHQAEALRRAHAILETIGEPKRVAFLLWALEGMTPAQIAQAMQASLSATRSRIFYAQKELMAAAKDDPYLRDWLGEHSDV